MEQNANHIPATLPSGGITHHDGLVVVSLVGVVVLMALLHLGTGAAALSPGQVMTALFDAAANPAHGAIVWNFRVPRILIATVAGALLGLAGALLQHAVGSPFAEPGLSGVAPAGALAIAALLTFAPGLAAHAWALPLAALTGGGLVGLLIAVLIHRRHGRNRWLLASGLALNLCAPVIAFSLLIRDVRIASFVWWCIGTLEQRSWTAWHTLWRWALPALALSLVVRWWPRTGILLAAATLLIAGAVGTIGAVGYVGLLAALLARQRPVFSALIGAALLLAADLGARMLTLVLPSLGLISEVPVGAVMTLIGIPWCIALFVRKTRRQRAVSETTRGHE